MIWVAEGNSVSCSAPLPLGCWSLALPLLDIYSPGAGDSHNSSSPGAFPEIRAHVYRLSPLRGLVGTTTKHDQKQPSVYIAFPLHPHALYLQGSPSGQMAPLFPRLIKSETFISNPLARLRILCPFA